MRISLLWISIPVSTGGELTRSNVIAIGRLQSVGVWSEMTSVEQVLGEGVDLRLFENGIPLHCVRDAYPEAQGSS